MKLFRKYLEDLSWGFFVPGSDTPIERSMSSRARAYTLLAGLILLVIGLAAIFLPTQGVNLPVEISNQPDLYTEFNLSVYPPTLVRQIKSLDWEGQYRETFITTKGIVYRWKDGPKVVEQILLKPDICTQIKGAEVLLTITTDQYITSPCDP